MKAATSRLAAQVGIIHLEELERLDSLGDAIDRAVFRVFRELQNATTFQAAFRIAERLPSLVVAELDKEFRAIIRTRQERVANAIADSLPDKYLDAALRLPILEERGQFEVSLGRGRLRAKRKEPAIDAATAQQRKDAFKELILPSLSEEVVSGIVYRGGRQAATERIRTLTNLGSPSALAATVAQGVSSGKNRVEIARELTPQLDGVRSSARRVARTEGARISNEANFATFEALGEMVIGYQIHAVLDHRSRPWHAHRNGRIYYKEPTQGQSGLDKMPRPPAEPQDPTERPLGTPAIAPNCRCFVSPVFRPIESLRTPKAEQAFKTVEEKIVPDPVTYSQWFAETTEKRKRNAVGSVRFSLVRDLLGREPEWVDFIDPDRGTVLPLATLKRETLTERFKRTSAVRQRIDQYRNQKSRVLSRGNL